MKKILVTGSGGLIGSEVVSFFSENQWEVHGVDNNMRAEFFGPQGGHLLEHPATPGHPAKLSSPHNRHSRPSSYPGIVTQIRPDAIVHAAAQPSHDLAASRPFDDFDVNAVGTLNLLEASRRSARESPFVQMSTNKVYGDAPNRLNLVEKLTRWDYADPEYANSIKETFSIDHSMHSVFGASKVAADVMAVGFGRYFQMPTCCLRAGCLTGPNHSGVELHGFLSYLIRCNLEGRTYNVFGYKGKQVRDNIHSYDVAQFINLFIGNPRQGEVYNVGGGRNNSISILEAFELITEISGKKMFYKYIDQNRKGDHICYISR